MTSRNSRSNVAESIYHDSVKFSLPQEPIDYARTMRVALIGGGMSGIACAYYLRKQIQNIDVTIYEKNHDFGGTWLENKYPGVACDVPAHSYVFTFAPNPDWSEFYASGHEIGEYVKGVAEKFELRAITKFNHRLTRAEWNEQDGKWHLNVQDANNDAEFTDNADVVISCTGVLNHWEWPNIEGMDLYKGKIIHTADWYLEPEGPAWNNRNVAVIGYGSSALQVVPALLPHANHIDNYVRGGTWIGPGSARTVLERYSDGNTGNHIYTEEEKRNFREHPEKLIEHRRELDDLLNGSHLVTLAASPVNGFARQMYTKQMRQMLSPKPELADILVPDYPPSCRRLTPNVQYLTALLKDNITVVTSEIKGFTETGLETTDGVRRDYDVVVTATGFVTTSVPRFPIIGSESINLQDAWSDIPQTYMGLCQEKFPNWFQLAGPNSAFATGSIVMPIERQAQWVTKCVSKMQKQGIKSMVVRKEAVDDFQAYVESYFPKTAFAHGCRSWYKRGQVDGKITALWPGSTVHLMRALEQPRFEDFEYAYLATNPTGNRFHWLGNGSTAAQDGMRVGERAWYVTGRPDDESGAMPLTTTGVLHAGA
ncbi:FAD/NAD-binding domain-containing protein [Trametopsis cervina]|nr:FAD/NAD-binding domain-containing protein [Trametopsis cervina]